VWDRLPPLGLAAALLLFAGEWAVKVGDSPSGRSLLAAGLVLVGMWAADELKKRR